MSFTRIFYAQEVKLEKIFSIASKYLCILKIAGVLPKPAASVLSFAADEWSWRDADNNGKTTLKIHIYASIAFVYEFYYGIRNE